MGLTWWITTVYGPTSDSAKADFLQELRVLRSMLEGPWCLRGDFNLIYRSADKSNDRLDLRTMSWFCRFLNDMGLEELYLNVRLFTWSNERNHPTLLFRFV